MNQPLEQAHNEELFDRMLAAINPNLWSINKVLNDSELNPVVIPFIIRAINDLVMTYGHGEVIIYVVKGRIDNIKANGNVRVDIEARIKR